MLNSAEAALEKLTVEPIRGSFHFMKLSRITEHAFCFLFAVFTVSYMFCRRKNHLHWLLQIGIQPSQRPNTWLQFSPMRRGMREIPLLWFTRDPILHVLGYGDWRLQASDRSWRVTAEMYVSMQWREDEVARMKWVSMVSSVQVDDSEVEEN
jgi:hypothetical protein